MIRKNVHRHEPVYRDVLKHAFLSAWRERRYWPLAFLASVLLLGSSYDVMLRSVDSIGEKSTAFGTAHLPDLSVPLNAISRDPFNIFNAAFALQALLAIAVIVIGFLALACIAQGGLVFALGASRRGKAPTLTDAFRIGGAAFWPVAAVNALALAAMWILRFVVAFPLYLTINDPTRLTWALYLVSFILFVPLVFVVFIVQIFAINAMILQGAPAAEAIVRGYQLFKKHWLTVMETAAILFFVTVGFGIVAGGLVFVGLIPLLVAILASAFLHSLFLFNLSIGIALVVLLVGGFVAAAMLTQLQVATWTYLYRKLGEGGVVPKIHRWMRTLIGTFSVPQS